MAYKKNRTVSRAIHAYLPIEIKIIHVTKQTKQYIPREFRPLVLCKIAVLS